MGDSEYKRDIVYCACNAEAIGIEHEKWKGGEETALAFWRYGGHKRKCHRLWHIWHIIRYGRPYSDMVVLTKEERHKLIEILTSYDKEK